MKIWIHINGVQEGPFEPDQLPLNRMDPQTPVWYEGLDYWRPASTAPVTAELLRAYYAGELQAQAGQRTAAQDHTVDVDTSSQSETRIDVDPQLSWQQASNHPAADMAQKYAAFSPARPSGQAEKCPPTYMVWSIILTLLCCNPIGIVSAVLGWTVTSKYREYDIEGARRRSETTAWWFIITIVTSLIFTPMYMLVSM